jgi:hypothetical protein
MRYKRADRGGAQGTTREPDQYGYQARVRHPPPVLANVREVVACVAALVKLQAHYSELRRLRCSTP